MSAFWEQNWKMFTSEINAGKAMDVQGAAISVENTRRELTATHSPASGPQPS